MENISDSGDNTESVFSNTLNDRQDDQDDLQDNLQDDQHVELLIEFLDSENKLQTILDLNEKSSQINDPTYVEVLSGIFKSYIMGKYDETHTSDFLNSLYNEIQIKNDSNVEQISLLISNILSNTEEMENFVMLNKLLSKTRKSHKDNISSEIGIHLTKFIWQQKGFRNVIHLYKKHNTGAEYCLNGIFRSFLIIDTPVWENKYELYLDAIKPLVEDEEIRSTFVEYLYNILKVNLPYTYEDRYVASEKKCSPINYNTFIMKILFKLINLYSLDVFINNIETGESYNVKNYELDELPLLHKLYMVTLYAIPICHTSLLKLYTGIKEESKIPFLLSSTRKLALKSKQEKILPMISCKIDNKFIQKLYLSYINVLPKIEHSELFGELVMYVDYITSFTRLETFYGTPDVELFNVLSRIVGGYCGHAKNVHIRHYACSLIFKLLNSEGFNTFENLFENLFKYISEVDFFEWSDPNLAISHQYKLVETIYFLTDLYDHEIEGGRDIIAGTLFSLLKSAIKIFNQIHDVCVYIKNRGLSVAGQTGQFQKMIDTISMTLQIHKSVYEKGIIKTVYPEVEDKYAILVYDLISASTDINHDLYTILRRPDLAASITNITYDSLSSHIDFCSKYLMKVRDTIIDNIWTYSKLPKDKKENIINKLTPTKKFIEYTGEFLDPILCTEIIDPVKIPDIDNEIFDKTGILTHIYDTKQNPYTRQPLTVQMLEEYNKKENIVEEIKRFLERKKCFEENYLMTTEDINRV